MTNSRGFGTRFPIAAANGRYWLLFSLVIVLIGFVQTGVHAPRSVGAIQIDVDYLVATAEATDFNATRLQQSQWTQATRTTNLGFQNHGVWYKLSLPAIPETADDTRWLLVIRQPYIDKLDLYIEEDKEHYKHLRYGDLLPFHTRDINHPFFLIALQGKPEPQSVYAYVNHPGPVQPSFELWPERAFFISDRAEASVKGLFFGILVFAIVLNSMLYKAYRHKQYLWYQASLIAGTLLQLILHGASTQLLWPNVPILNSMVPLLLAANVGTASMFTYHFLNISGLARKLILGLASATLVVPVLFVFDNQVAMRAAFLMIFVVLIVLPLVSIHACFIGRPYSRFFLFALLPMLIGVSTSLAQGFGLLNPNPFWTSGPLWGLAINALLLTYILGRRLHLENVSQIETQQKLIEEKNLLIETESRLLSVLRTHPVTALPNRSAFANALEIAIEKRTPEQNATEALHVWAVELRRFRFIECTLGSSAVEQLLQSFSAHLATIVESVFPDELVELDADNKPDKLSPGASSHTPASNILASIDTPVLAFSVVTDETQQNEAADVILRELGKPFEFQGIYWALQPCLASARERCDTLDSNGINTLIANACVGLAECSAYHPWVDFNELQAQSYLESRRFSWDISGAMQRKEMTLVFQPKVWLKSRSILGFETLLRWQHPEQGNIPPFDIVQHAERTGMINSLTLFVCDEAATFVKTLLDQGHQNLCVAINISPFDLISPRFVGDVTRMFETHGLDPARIIFEVTEASAIEGVDIIIEHMNALKALGIRFSMDDFGTGFSSLNLLNELPLDELKIDRSLLTDILESDKAKNTMASVVGLGLGLHLNTVAEGIEDKDTYQWLASVGDIVGQGYFIGRPMTASACLHWIETWQSEHSSANSA